jgi:cobalt-zinc-cadmium efflux system membrane fusion protein
LALHIFEKDISKLFIGQKVITYTNSNPEKKYPCEIILIGKDVTKDRSAEVHCHFEQYDKTLIPGMYMNAEIEIDGIKATVIPNDGIVRYEGKQYVFIVVEKNKFEMQEVTTLNTENGITQIEFENKQDVEEKLFVTKGAYTLLMTLKNTKE